MILRWYLCRCGGAWVGLQGTKPVVWIRCGRGRCSLCRQVVGDFCHQKSPPPYRLREKAARVLAKSAEPRDLEVAQALL